MQFNDLVQKRRSIRKYTDQQISAENLHTILRAGLMAPTGHNTRAWRFYVVTDKQQLIMLSQAKSIGAEFLKGANVAIVVAYDTSSETWIEDAAIAAITMQYQAADLGIGSTWAQLRGRTTAEGESTHDYLQRLLHIEDGFEVVCALGLGYAQEERKLQDENKLAWDKVLGLPS